MKIKNIALAICFIMPHFAVHADESKLTKEQLQDKIEVKIKEMNNLRSKIFEQEEILKKMTTKIQELGKTLYEEKEKELKNETSNKTILPGDPTIITNKMLQEHLDFCKNFFEDTSKKQLYITSKKYFGSSIEEMLFKFYVVANIHEMLILNDLLDNWEKCSDELILLHKELDPTFFN